MNWTIDCDHPERIITIPKGASASAVADLLNEESCMQNKGCLLYTSDAADE